MKKTLIFIINFSSLLIIGHVCHTLDALTAFFIAGIIPGTTYSVSPIAMLSFFFITSAALLFAGSRLFSPDPVQKVLPKKRYGRL